MDLRRVEAAREIATTLSKSRNKIYLEADNLLLNLTSPLNANLEKTNQPRVYENRASTAEKSENVAKQAEKRQ